MIVLASRIGDFFTVGGIVGVVIVVLVLLIWGWLNTQRTWFGGWRKRGPMGK